MKSFREYLNEEFNSTSLILYTRCDIPKFNNITEFNYENLSHVHFYDYNEGMYCFTDLESALNPDAERRYGEYILKFTIPGGVKNFFYTSYEAYKQAVNPNAKDGKHFDDVPFIDEQLKKFGLDKETLLRKKVYPVNTYPKTIFDMSDGNYKTRGKTNFSGVRNFQNFIKYLEVTGYIPKYIKGFEYYSNEDKNAFIVFDNKAIVPLALYDTKGKKLFDISKETKKVGYQNSRKNLSVEKLQKNQKQKITDINLRNMNLTSIKDAVAKNIIGFKIPKICTNFDVSGNSLKNLIGCPRVILGELDASHNKLTSLEGFPPKTPGRVNISNNQLTSLKDLKYDPYLWFDIFDCSSNNLTSLEGAPKECNVFDCSNNKLTTLAPAPRSVISFFNCSNNQLTTLYDISPSFKVDKIDVSKNKLSKEEVIRFSEEHRYTVVVSDFGEYRNGDKIK